MLDPLDVKDMFKVASWLLVRHYGSSAAARYTVHYAYVLYTYAPCRRFAYYSSGQTDRSVRS